MKRALAVLCFVQLAIIAAPADAKPVKRHPGNATNAGYLVLLAPEMASGVEGVARSLAATYNLDVRSVWTHIGGFFCEGSLEAAAKLADDPRVAIVEEDHKLYGPTSGLLPKNWTTSNERNRVI